jgi:hypothetical protein
MNKLITLCLVLCNLSLAQYDRQKIKLLVLDKQFHSILHFDQAWQPGTETPLNGFFGYQGDDPREFWNPTGICIGRKYEYGSNDVYKVFIADEFNLRIGMVDYVADQNGDRLGYFDHNSWREIFPMNYPHDVAYFRYRGPYDLDRLWVSEAMPVGPSYLRCNSTSSNHYWQSFIGYKDGDGNVYYFLEGTNLRVDVHSPYNPTLVFVDNLRNNLVACHLEDDGTAPLIEGTYLGDYILADTVLHFPDDYRINSVHFHSPSEDPNVSQLKLNPLPYLWVTSDYYVHCLKLLNLDGTRDLEILKAFLISLLPSRNLSCSTYESPR